MRTWLSLTARWTVAAVLAGLGVGLVDAAGLAAAVVLLPGLALGLGQRLGGDGDGIVPGQRQPDIRIVRHHPPVPAEPQARALAQRVPDRHGEAARLRAVRQIRHTVRGHDQPAHSMLSQGCERRIAPLMIPTIE
ncbi:MAG: hypothetical protein GVY27_07415 [Deinococcus-Thermus bacterium]|jgi:hypothetical protein|nr:hypothetical protein [Deinococcota bacterium]